MTFGILKTHLENILIESFGKKTKFKENISFFKKDLENNKSYTKIHSLYDDLSTPQGLSESDANEFLNEGINLLQKLIPKVKLPSLQLENTKNNYSEIDTLVYLNGKNIDLKQRLQMRKNILERLMSNKTEIRESVKIPISSMVSIGNKTIKTLLEELNENDKIEILELLEEDKTSLKTKFSILKENTSKKLQKISEKETNTETKKKIQETINKIQKETFNELNYYKLKKLSEGF